MIRILVILLLFAGSFSASAHQLSTAYLTATASANGEINGTYQVRLFDIERALGIDTNHDGKVVWGELKSRRSAIRQYLLRHLSLSRSGKHCTVNFNAQWQIDNHYNEPYLVLPLRALCLPAGAITVNYHGFYNIDSSHKLLLSLTDKEAGTTASRILSKSQPSTRVKKQSSVWAGFGAYVYQGMWHIWVGFDHILFLLSLLLTCVLIRRHKRWQGQTDTRALVLHTIGIITTFTLAHSITLSLTALNIIHLPSRWIEAGIAATIVLTALNNVFPVVLRLGVITFSFGLLHGMGFASVLGELGLPPGSKLITVLAFNLGVEIGQLAIIALILPVLIIVRTSRWYSRYAMPLGSLVIAGLGSYWLINRL